MCWLCLLLMAGIWLGDLTGAMPVREAPPSQSARVLSEQGQRVIYGRIHKYHYSENSTGICLEDVFYKSRFSGESLLPLDGTIVYMQEGSYDLPLGTWIRAEGELEEIPGPRNPGEFDSRLYYRARKIYYRMRGQRLSVYREETRRVRESLRQLRESLVDSLEKGAPKQAGILSAMAAGEKRLLNEEEKNLLAAGSISHILSISGMHVSLLGMLLFYILAGLGMGLIPASASSAGLMIFYGVMTGESVSAMRALGMFGLAMMAKAAGRSYDLLSALSLSVILILLDNPVCLYYSGFLLSCGCICGVGLVLPCLEKMFSLEKIKKKFLRNLAQSLVMGMAVQSAVLPLTAWFFYEIPLYGILVNLLVIPTLTVTLVSALLGAALGMWQVWLGRLALLPGCVLAEYYQELCKIVRQLPGAALTVGRPGMWQVVLYYAVLGTVLFLGSRMPRERLAVCFFFWCAGTGILCTNIRQRLEITCLDVGQGDGGAICTPQGECYLVDGGSSSRRAVGKYCILPFLKSQGISCVNGAFVSHTDADHINGLVEILEMIRDGETSLKIQYLVMPRLEIRDESQKKLEILAGQAGAEVRYLGVGEKVKGEKICWQALSPLKGRQSMDINENSLVLLLENDGFRGLFTGDIGEEQEEKLEAGLPDCDFLKVAHHGSRYSTGEEFLAKVRPEIAVASASASNNYGHPHPDTLKCLRESGCHVFLTKDSGGVTLEAGEGTVEVRPYLKTDSAGSR